MTLPIAEAHARQLARLRARSPDVRLVVIGAAALGHHVELTRVTSDVDLVVVLEPHDVEVRDVLAVMIARDSADLPVATARGGRSLLGDDGARRGNHAIGRRRARARDAGDVSQRRRSSARPRRTTEIERRAAHRQTRVAHSNAPPTEIAAPPHVGANAAPSISTCAKNEPTIGTRAPRRRPGLAAIAP